MSKNKTVWLALLTMLLCGSLFPMVKLGFSAYEVKGTADILLFEGIRFVICGAVICLFSAVKDKTSVVPQSSASAYGLESSRVVSFQSSLSSSLPSPSLPVFSAR